MPPHEALEQAAEQGASATAHEAPASAGAARGAGDDQKRKAVTAAANLVLADALARPRRPPAMRAGSVLVPDATERVQRRKQEDADIARLTPLYGQAPKAYRGLLDAPTNEFGHRLIAALPVVVRFINEQLAKMGSTASITEAELAVNFIAEGAAQDLLSAGASGSPDEVDEWRSAGLTHLDQQLQALGSLIHPSVLAHRDRGAPNPATAGDVKVMPIEQVLYASAAVFADSRRALEVDLRKRGVELGSLSPRARFYWTTVYFNAGEDVGAQVLAKQGIAAAERPSTQAHVSVSKDPMMNATWRSATWDLVREHARADGRLGDTVQYRQVPVEAYAAETQGRLERSLVAMGSSAAPFAPLPKELDLRLRVLTTAAPDGQGHRLGARGGLIEELVSDQAAQFGLNEQWRFVLALRDAMVGQGHAELATIYARLGRKLPNFATMSLEQLVAELAAVEALPLDAFPEEEARVSMPSSIEGMYALIGRKMPDLTAMAPDELAAEMKVVEAALAKQQAPKAQGLTRTAVRKVISGYSETFASARVGLSFAVAGSDAAQLGAFAREIDTQYLPSLRGERPLVTELGRVMSQNLMVLERKIGARDPRIASWRRLLDAYSAIGSSVSGAAVPTSPLPSRKELEAIRRKEALGPNSPERMVALDFLIEHLTRAEEAAAEL